MQPKSLLTEAAIVTLCLQGEESGKQIKSQYIVYRSADIQTDYLVEESSWEGGMLLPFWVSNANDLYNSCIDV